MKSNQNPSSSAQNCEDIQSVLLAYMTRELGKARSELVGRHLQKCRDCQREAADIQATLDLLRQEREDDPVRAPRLSDDRRRRIAWSLDHPVLDWVYAHHAIVSIGIALCVLAAILWLALRPREPEPEDPLKTLPPVTIGGAAQNRDAERRTRQDPRQEETPPRPAKPRPAP